VLRRNATSFGNNFTVRANDRFEGHDRTVGHWLADAVRCAVCRGLYGDDLDNRNDGPGYDK
jgi:hypothetical protein